MLRNFHCKLSWHLLLTVLLVAGAAWGVDAPTSLGGDRELVERVYYKHRPSPKPAFDEVMKHEEITRLVRLDLKKEKILKEMFGVVITDAMLQEEVEHLNNTFKPPEVLAEIKDALGDDPSRFARAVARPSLVDKLLHTNFSNEVGLHTEQRRDAETLRHQLLDDPAGVRIPMQEVTLELTPRPVEVAPVVPPIPPKKEKKHDPDQSPVRPPEKPVHFYMEDLPVEVQQQLSSQLLKPGDVSTVIEMPAGFLVYRLTERSDAAMFLTLYSVPKRSYERWVAEQ